MFHPPRSLGTRVILSYKLIKAPVILVAALWLSLAPHSAVHIAERIVREISEGGATLGRLAHWLEPHLSSKFALHAAAIAWIDGTSTLAEGLLLLQGSVWGQWIVVAALGALVPAEAFSLARHPSLIRLAVLSINALIVLYLVFDRLRKKRHAAS